MQSRTIGLLLFALLIAVVGCTKKDDKSKDGKDNKDGRVEDLTSRQPQQKDQAKVPAGWQVVASKIAAFTVLLPDGNVTQEVDTSRSFVTEDVYVLGKTWMFSVDVFENDLLFRPGAAEKAFATWREKEGDREITNEKKITLGGHPGLEWQIIDRTANKKSRIKKRVYVIGRHVISLRGSTDTPEEMQTFLNSLSIKEVCRARDAEKRPKGPREPLKVPGGWKAISSDLGGFEVVLPKGKEKKKEEEHCNQVEYEVDAGDVGAFNALVTQPRDLRYPGKDETALDDAVQKWLRNSGTNGKVEGQKKIAVDGCPGREFAVFDPEYKERTKHVRIFVIGEFLVELSCKKASPENRTTFLESFRLQPAKAK